MKLEKTSPELNQEDTIKFTCISGLLCRVAYADMEVTVDESKEIISILKNELGVSQVIAEKITNLSLEQTKELSGIENHRYTGPLCESLSREERYQLLKSLFLIAASDGNADNLECEEIRIISKGLKLEQKHYAAARASVKDFLGSLRD